MRRNLRRPLILSLVISLLVVGCAGEQAFRQGKQLLSEGKAEEGLAQLEQAVKEDPNNVEFRTRLIRERDALMQRILTQSDSARSKGQFEEAAAGYNRVLKLEAGNERAQRGIEGIKVGKRHNGLLVEGDALFTKGDYDAAQEKVREILLENPNQQEAIALQRRLDEKATRDKIETPLLKSNFKKPITLEFRDANLKTVFEVISRTAGINFIFDKDVRPDLKATIFVRNSSMEDVIKLLLVTNQLEQKILNDNTILIYPNIPAKSRDYQDLVVKSFYLANADVKQTLNMIKTVLKTRDVFIDEKLNLLIMRDSPEAIRLAEKLVAAQDLAEPEVMLDVEVLEVKRSRLLELGIQYPNQFTVLGPQTTQTTANTTGGTIQVNTATTSGQLTVENLKHLNASQIGIPNPVLNLRKEDSDVNLLANPRIRVKNREKAKIHIGDKVPVITTTSTANVGISESVTYLDVGLKLDVEPNVSLDNDVSIKVGLEVSNIVREIKGASGTLTYQLGTRTAATALRLKDGETQVLAGLINDEDRETANKVPGLGEIPLLGRLFSSHRNDSTKTEIVLLITPHIVRNIIRPDAGIMEFSSGTEGSLGNRSIGLRSVNVSGAVKQNAGIVPPPAPFGGGQPVPAQPVQPLQPLKPVQPVTQPGTVPPGVPPPADEDPDRSEFSPPAQ